MCSSDLDEFLESMKTDLFSDEVHAFTPKGEVKVLPRGSTPVDFAYAVHTKVGERIVGARVDGVMVPLKHQLRNGNVVEILTRPDAHPSQDWLEFVATTRARTKIRGYIHAEQRARALEVGRDLLEKTFRRVKMSLARAAEHERMPKVLAHFKAPTMDDLAVLIGFGKVQGPDLLAWMFPEQTELGTPEAVVEQPIKRPRHKAKGAAAITVDGIDDVMVRFGKCCSPVPGDPIVGIVTRGRGITVHTRGCRCVLDADPLRRLECNWNTASGAGATVLDRKSTRLNSSHT